MERILTISELILQLKSKVEEEHRFVEVMGEVSSFKLWRSGHAYFDIKDDKALMPAVIFRPFLEKLSTKVNDGQKAIFKGKISIYPQNSRLQMIVEKIEALGEGVLLVAFNELKEKLLKEGLFEESLKKPLPAFPKRVGIVTSPQGAALRDMLKILFSRWPNLSVLLYSSKVQGEGAKEEISKGIKVLDESRLCDLIIVGRGGGSLEDLWAFNEEVVARAIFNAKTPIISAVGHETDFSISDMVADVRAATPTHAASMAVADFLQITESLENIKGKLRSNLISKIKNKALLLSYIKKRLLDPRFILYKYWQDLDRKKNNIDNFINNKIKKAQNEFINNVDKLDSLSPLKVLKRGYGVVEIENRLIKSKKELNLEDKINITFYDGKVLAKVLE